MNCLHSVNQGNESVSGSQLLTCPVPERSGKAAEWEISSVFIVHKCWRGCGEKEPSYTVGGNAN